MRHRCQAQPIPDHQVSFRIDGTERIRWHHGSDYPRPFFYPLVGPSGISLTRMGHPGASNHDHHRSVWFAHNKILGIDFWADTGEARITQRQWLAYEDGEEFAAMGVLLDWVDGHDPQPLIEQTLLAAVMPGPREGETLVELDTSFRPKAEELELGMTNFGFMAVRVAKDISAYFGGGSIRDSEGRHQEREIFGESARWVDYSGQIATRRNENGSEESIVEGVTLFEHPSNAGYPHRWHVREDGWMGPSQCREAPLVIRNDAPLRLRFLLHAHRGAYDADRAIQVADHFASLPQLKLEASNQPHREHVISRPGD